MFKDPCALLFAANQSLLSMREIEAAEKIRQAGEKLGCKWAYTVGAFWAPGGYPGLPSGEPGTGPTPPMPDPPWPPPGPDPVPWKPWGLVSDPPLAVRVRDLW